MQAKASGEEEGKRGKWKRGEWERGMATECLFKTKKWRKMWQGLGRRWEGLRGWVEAY